MTSRAQGSAIDEPVPLATTPVGSPLAYAALGLAFHLEPLGLDDGPRLASALDHVLAATGKSGTPLRWAFSSVHGEVEPFGPGVLDLVAGYPATLAIPDDVLAIPDARARSGAIAMTAAHVDRFGVACHGGATRNVASPTTVRFFAAAASPSMPDATLLRGDAAIMATLPLSTTPAALSELARAVAGELRIRWGVAGLTYGVWELDRYGETRDAVYAHARRHPGFDVGQHATWMRELHDRLRTVSWLTFLGPELAARVRPSNALANGAGVEVTPLGEGVVLRAGDRPEAGDVNRRLFPPAYVEVDRRLRAVRAAEELHFYAPWSAQTTEQWLRRFEVG